MKKTIPLVLAFVTGILMMFEPFIPHYTVNTVKTLILEWGQVIAAATILLGIASLVVVNIPAVTKRKQDWVYKLVLLIAFFVTVVLGSRGVEAGTMLDWVFMNMMRPMMATMFALLAFYMASAAFRAFRARTFEATLMLGAALLVMMGRVPLGELVFRYITDIVNLIPGVNFTIVDVMEWIMNIPNLAGKRAIFIGAALGTMATSLRIILGLERSYMGGDD